MTLKNQSCNSQADQTASCISKNLYPDILLGWLNHVTHILPLCQIEPNISSDLKNISYVKLGLILSFILLAGALTCYWDFEKIKHQIKSSKICIWLFHNALKYKMSVQLAFNYSQRCTHTFCIHYFFRHSNDNLFSSHLIQKLWNIYVFPFSGNTYIFIEVCKTWS